MRHRDVWTTTRFNDTSLTSIDLSTLLRHLMRRMQVLVNSWAPPPSVSYCTTRITESSWQDVKIVCSSRLTTICHRLDEASMLTTAWFRFCSRNFASEYRFGPGTFLKRHIHCSQRHLRQHRATSMNHNVVIRNPPPNRCTRSATARRVGNRDGYVCCCNRWPSNGCGETIEIIDTISCRCSAHGHVTPCWMRGTPAIFDLHAPGPLTDVYTTCRGS